LRTPKINSLHVNMLIRQEKRQDKLWFKGRISYIMNKPMAIGAFERFLNIKIFYNRKSMKKFFFFLYIYIYIYIKNEQNAHYA
jgi:hypothetical protein